MLKESACLRSGDGEAGRMRNTRRTAETPRSAEDAEVIKGQGARRNRQDARSANDSDVPAKHIACAAPAKETPSHSERSEESRPTSPIFSSPGKQPLISGDQVRSKSFEL